MVVWICDDNELFARQYRQFVETALEEQGMPAQVRTFASGEALLTHAGEPRPDAVFLDVLMEPVDGLQTAKALRERGYDGFIVLITSSREYAIDGYKVGAFRYLLKPVEQETISLLLAEMRRVTGEEALTVPSGKSVLALRRADIVYIERANRRTHIHLRDGQTVETALRLDELERQLDSAFARCHKSFIVGLRYCARIGAGEVSLRDGTQVSVSRPYAQQIKADFFRYHRQKLQ